MLKPRPKERPIISALLRRYDDNFSLIKQFHKTLLDILQGDSNLRPLVHSFRARLKAPDHLEDKLLRKLRECADKKVKFKITPDNLLTKINDLAGIRILHLYTSQIEQIHEHLSSVLKKFEYEIIEGPAARTWDDEYRAFFSGLGFETKSSESMYTSVHYVVGSSSKLKMTCEIQVRTLMEEVWGEVDHKINYPHKTKSIPCREQIRALARATSTSTRLVDAIFATIKDEQKRSSAKLAKAPKRRLAKKKLRKRH